jgi:hypothetical protein
MCWIVRGGQAHARDIRFLGGAHGWNVDYGPSNCLDERLVLSPAVPFWGMVRGNGVERVRRGGLGLGTLLGPEKTDRSSSPLAGWWGCSFL